MYLPLNELFPVVITKAFGFPIIFTEILSETIILSSLTSFEPV